MPENGLTGEVEVCLSEDTVLATTDFANVNYTILDPPCVILDLTPVDNPPVITVQGKVLSKNNMISQCDLFLDPGATAGRHMLFFL